ncbi:MAG: hypothetical protein RL088_3025 [Verrucomicrobiota bacterium]
MKTEISRFCGACAESVAPLPAALDAACAQFERRPEALAAPLAALNDIRARLRSLTEKLRNQQAYVLIFGPLKSGKSTLMNAISGSYVSEVTSLPGYPCLVFVRDHSEPRFTATRYNGRETLFADKSVLAASLTEAHLALAQQIRTSEAKGETFDPRTNFPEAIRRIDIRLPVPALSDSATVLVDTPGLYSRMNFGYDVLTREFRDSAACAVFVVKTDNLFLEQVFAEFNQLLGLFSRIFIVVNVDAGKRDLAPDGSLRPSAESENPASVIEAFTTLSMAGPMREAYEAGRVRIHAVDLLGAAASFLSHVDENPHRASFDAFIEDLTNYLNSSDYMREFVRDSIRQAHALCNEAHAAATGPEIAALARVQQERGRRITAVDERIAATDRLLARNWAAMFQDFNEGISRNASDLIRSRVLTLREEMRQSLERWFSVDDSLDAICSTHWNKPLVDTGRDILNGIIDITRRAASGANAGLGIDASTRSDMDAAGFSPGAAGASAMESIAPVFDTSPYAATIDPASVPVRKMFLDWLLFRSAASVQSRLFGADGKQGITVRNKERRLQEPSRAALNRHLEGIISERFPNLPEKFATAIAADYSTRAAAEITKRLRELRELLVRERAELHAPFIIDAGVLAAASNIECRAASVRGDIELLAMQENINTDGALDEAQTEADGSYIPELPPLLPG